MAQPGPIQTQEAGISNYQIQATTPTTTPVVGKQYLYNANNILSTKDSAGTVTRVNKETENILANPDFEQVLDSYTFTAGRAVINTLTPLFDKRSVDLDTTAINDNISTVPYLIPKGLQGQNCMAKLTYSGGDANLTMRVMNADGIVVGQKVLAVAANSTPAFIVFNCPPGTATVNQRTLRIDVIQNSATNAALATLDSFYLGRFESNTMTVQEQPQWYYFTANTTISGDFAFPAPTASSNNGALFSYAGTNLTALKPLIITIDAFATGNIGTGANVDGRITCIKDGVSRVINGFSYGITNQAIGGPTINGTLNLSVGDTCKINFFNTVGFISHTVNITATPLPQLATIVNTNTPRAGFLGKKRYFNTNCQWVRSNAVMGPFGVDPDCTANAVMEGKAIPDAVSNGQLPAITLSTLPKGKIKVTLMGYFYNTQAVSTIYSVDLALNGTILNLPELSWVGQTVALAVPVRVYEFTNASDLTNAKIEIFGSGSSNAEVSIQAYSVPFTILVEYMPDLSDPYSIPELYAALPPQVINSSGKIWRTEGCLVINSGTASLGSTSCNTWINSVSRTAAGRVTINFLPNIWAVAPQCTGNYADNGGLNLAIHTATISSVQTRLSTNTTDVPTDQSFNFSCGGLW